MRENWETMTISGTAVDHGIFVALSFVDVVKVVFTLFFFFFNDPFLLVAQYNCRQTLRKENLEENDRESVMVLYNSIFF